MSWLKENHQFKNPQKYQIHYKYVSSLIKEEFEESILWKNLCTQLNEYNDEYRSLNGYHLLLNQNQRPEIVLKPYDSFVDKTFRKNILNNKNWPNPPQSGWILPIKWYSQINDIIRTCIVVKYLDGVKFLTDKIKGFCDDSEKNCRIFYEAREEGYYASHLYLKNSFEIPDIKFDTIFLEISIEIQITTQLQELIRSLLHRYYEERRKYNIQKKEKWQWDYESDEFYASYLGHILHFLEGLIVNIREKK